MPTDVKNGAKEMLYAKEMYWTQIIAKREQEHKEALQQLAQEHEARLQESHMLVEQARRQTIIRGQQHEERVEKKFSMAMRIWEKEKEEEWKRWALEREKELERAATEKMVECQRAGVRLALK